MTAGVLAAVLAAYVAVLAVEVGAGRACRLAYIPPRSGQMRPDYFICAE